MAKKGTLTGLLLFGIFFGAGNLIFPPSLGALSGEHFLPAIAGFVFSGVGIAVLTLIIGTLNPKGYIYEISTKIAPWFATLYLSVLYLSIGPFFATPRTATTAYEVGISPLLSDANKGLGLIVFTVLYFAAAYLISLNPSKTLRPHWTYFNASLCNFDCYLGRSGSYQIWWNKSSSCFSCLSSFCLWYRFPRRLQYLGRPCLSGL